MLLETQQNYSKSYINLILTLAYKNVKVRYKNSILGFFWSLLSPLIFLLIFVTVFSSVFSDIENYPLYALTGLIFWIFFSSTTIQIIGSVLESAGILKSVNIPPIIFPISSLVASLINLLLSFIPFIILMYFFGFKVSFNTLWIFPVLLNLALFTFGFSLIMCSLNVFFRDIGMFWNSLLPAFFYFTPIAYSVKMLPEETKWILKLNPLFHYFENIRDVLYLNTAPSTYYLFTSTLLTITFLGTGIIIFKKLEKGFISNY